MIAKRDGLLRAPEGQPVDGEYAVTFALVVDNTA